MKKPLAPAPVDSTKVWLIVMATVAVVFLVATVNSLIQTIRATRPAAPTVSMDEFAGVAPSDTAAADAQTPPANRIKLLEMNVAPVRRAVPERPFVQPSEEEVKREIVRAQAEAQRELARKYPKSPFVLTPKEINELEAKGIIIN